MITNIKLYGAYAPAFIMEEGLMQLVSQFSEMLEKENCRLSDYSVKEKSGSFRARRYDVEFVWTGDSNAIKTDYEGWIHCKTTADFVELK